MSLSKGAKKLKGILQEIYGKSVKIKEEHYLGEGLRLDFYVPDYGLGFEYHGRQHEEFVEHFHGDASGFRESKRRDARKIELCAEQDIALVTIWYHQDLTKELVLGASLEALSSFVSMNSSVEEPEEKDEYREKRLAIARKARKERYQWAKARKAERR